MSPSFPMTCKFAAAWCAQVRGAAGVSADEVAAERAAAGADRRRHRGCGVQPQVLALISYSLCCHCYLCLGTTLPPSLRQSAVYRYPTAPSPTPYTTTTTTTTTSTPVCFFSIPGRAVISVFCCVWQGQPLVQHLHRDRPQPSAELLSGAAPVHGMHTCVSAWSDDVTLAMRWCSLAGEENILYAVGEGFRTAAARPLRLLRVLLRGGQWVALPCIAEGHALGEADSSTPMHTGMYCTVCMYVCMSSPTWHGMAWLMRRRCFPRMMQTQAVQQWLC